MKKTTPVLALVLILSAVVPASALSYDNNEFQRKSRAYTELAAKAYDEGDYDAAVEYARQAEDNASLSSAFIEKMLVRADTQTVLFRAHTRLTWAREKKAEKYFPDVFDSASRSIAAGDDYFTAENFAEAKKAAESALDSLSVVREIIPLPATWKVKLWLSTRDCLWNIAANPAVYGNPLLWEELYKANREALKQPANPNLVMPGMEVVIPSLFGEYREGAYDPKIKYEPLSSQIRK